MVRWVPFLSLFHGQGRGGPDRGGDLAEQVVSGGAGLAAPRGCLLHLHPVAAALHSPSPPERRFSEPEVHSGKSVVDSEKAQPIPVAEPLNSPLGQVHRLAGSIPVMGDRGPTSD